MATQTAVRQKRVRYRSKSGSDTFLRGVSVLFLGSGAALIGVGFAFSWRQNSDGPGAIGVGSSLFVAGLFFVPAFWPVLVLTTHTLRRPRVLRRALVTPLDEITGIGLVHMRAVGASTPTGWFLYLWTTFDIPRDLEITYYYPATWGYPPSEVRRKFLAVEPSAAERAAPFDRAHFSYNFDPVTQTDPDKLSATHAGRAAREIYDRVSAYQGPTGFLAIRQDQKHVPVIAAFLYDGTVLRSLAYWSPDGELGRTPSAPQSRQSSLPGSLPPGMKQPGMRLRAQYRIRLLGRKLHRRRGTH